MLQDIVVGEGARDKAEGQNAQENIENNNTPVSLLLSFAQASFFQKSFHRSKKSRVKKKTFYLGHFQTHPLFITVNRSRIRSVHTKPSKSGENEKILNKLETKRHNEFLNSGKS